MDGRVCRGHDAAEALRGRRIALPKPTATACKSGERIGLTKIRIVCYIFYLSESNPRLGEPGRGQSRRLFENLADHNPLREFETEADFPDFLDRNRLKSLDSEK
jgi:hypothetical protein